MSGALEAIEPPLPAEVHGRCWYTRRATASTAYGCWSHAGPPWVAADKDNEDFAFAVEHQVRGEPWLLLGVADGVSSSTWAERAAQHAAAAFLATTQVLLASADAAELQLRDRAFRRRHFCEPLCADLRRRFAQDDAAIVRAEMVHPSWDPALYRESFLVGARAADQRQRWFQTTLLAGALGPRGGFALLLGDGFVCVDRTGPGARQRTVVDLVPVGEGGADASVISRWLEVDDLDAAFRNVPPLGADELALIVATDGVSRTPANGLDAFTPDDAGACRRLLDELAARPHGRVESDNLSVAFGRCKVRS